MRRQTVKLVSKCGTFVQRHITVEEAERLIGQGTARRVSRSKDPVMRVQLITHPEPSSSQASRAALSLVDTQVLATLRPREATGRLTADDLREMPAHRVATLQRLCGWGLLPRSEALENYAE